MKPAEAKAKFLFESVDPAAELEYVEEQSRSVHDFWVLQQGVRVAAVEVTSAHSPEINRAYAAILDERKGGPFVTGRLVTMGWWIHAVPSANVNRIRRDADRYLAAIESEGLTAFDADFAYESPSVTAIVTDLGVQSGRSVTWRQPRQIGIGLPGQSTWQSPDHVLGVVREVASLQDNRSKLGRAPVARRILFIEVASTCYDAWAGMTSCDPPTLPPDLPAEATEVWVVATIADDHMVWRWDSEQGWRSTRIHQRMDRSGRAV